MKTEVENSIISPVLNKYKDVQMQIKNKTKERKDLQSKKKSISSIHILQHTQLSRQITALTEDIEELQSRKKMLLDEMYCKEESQVVGIEQRLTDNVTILETLRLQKETLTKEKESGKDEYMNISDKIAAEDFETVQIERSNIRDVGIAKVQMSLQETYGNKYSSALFKEAEMNVSNELQENPLSKKSVYKAAQKKTRHIPKKYEHEL